MGACQGLCGPTNPDPPHPPVQVFYSVLNPLDQKIVELNEQISKLKNERLELELKQQSVTQELKKTKNRMLSIDIANLKQQIQKKSKQISQKQQQVKQLNTQITRDSST